MGVQTIYIKLYELIPPIQPDMSGFFEIILEIALNYTKTSHIG